MKRTDRKKWTHLNHGLGGDLCGHPELPERQTSGSQSKLNLKQNDKTEAVLRRAHHEKAGVFGKDSNAGGRGGSRERGGPDTRWTDSVKEP